MSLKLQMLVTSLFIAVLAGLFSLSSRGGETKDTPAIAKQQSERSIEVIRATWGANCNEYISQMRASPYADTAESLPGPVMHNNALHSVSSLCNGKDACHIPAGATLLKEDPAPHCRKNLEVKYRCNAFERANLATSKDGEPIALLCAKTPQAAVGQDPKKEASATESAPPKSPL